MSIRLLLLSLLLSYALALDHVQTQNPPGFINMDCGRTEPGDYMDAVTGLLYSTDAAYIETGESRSISPEFRTVYYPEIFWNLRSFPGPNGSRNCYTLWPENVAKGNKTLLRVAFLYGNYDNQNAPPQFDLHLGTDYWETVATISYNNSPPLVSKEILHVPASDYVHVCLVNTGLGTPFITALELRPINSNKPVYNTASGSLKYFVRWDSGLARNSYIRYPADIYDRIWFPYNNEDSLSASIINTSETNFIQNSYNVPAAVMGTAIQARRRNLSFFVVPRNPADCLYFYFHFAELSANQSREISVYVNGVLYGDKQYYLDYLRELTIFTTVPAVPSLRYEITINATTNSENPAIINAMEVYIAKQFQQNETDHSDVSAIGSIKATYGIKRNWQGDRCLPRAFAWVGLNCSDNGNLSSSGLNGTIAPSISNLSAIQFLDLSYNNLSGQVPDFISWLPSLKYLNLSGNNFTGPLPPDLLKKAGNGSLILSFGSRSNNPKLQANGTGTTGKKKKIETILVPVVASVATLFGIAILSVLWKKWRVSRGRLNMVEGKGERHSKSKPSEFDCRSLVRLKFRRFEFSEVESLIADGNIVGEGAHGTVYHGSIHGIQVAIKMLKVLPDLEFRDFQSEVNILATIHHKNLTSLLGYWNEGANKGIIFEFMQNGNLESYLSGKNPKQLSWEQRLKIMIGAAKGLEYLHHGCNPPIIHRDIKPANILLTKDFEAQLADFGMSRAFPIQSTRIVGTPGYIDPVYQGSGMLNEQSDVYSFGVLMLVVVTGRPAIINGKTLITQWISSKIQQADIRGIVDPRIEVDNDITNAAWRVVELATSCLCPDSTKRPTMNDVVKELTENLTSTLAQNELADLNDLDEIATADMDPSVFRPHTR